MNERRRRVWITLAVLLTLATPSLAVSDDLIEYFNSQYIPVKDITTDGAKVKVVYVMGPLDSPEAFGENILYIYGKVAREYPGAESAEVRCMRGEDTVYVYETSTGNVKRYVNSEISGDEFKSGITVRDGSKGGPLRGIDFRGNESMVIVLAGLAGLLLLIILTISLCLTLRKRRVR